MYTFIWKARQKRKRWRGTQGGGESEIHFSNGFINHFWARSKSGARKSIQVPSYMCSRCSSTCAIIPCFPRYIIRMSMGSRASRTSTTTLIWDAKIISGGLISYVTMPSPEWVLETQVCVCLHQSHKIRCISNAYLWGELEKDEMRASWDEKSFSEENLRL